MPVLVAALRSLVVILVFWTVHFGETRESSLPAMIPTVPYSETPFDTTIISSRAPKEARLACQSIVPLFRAAVCDISTFDNCGNLYGRPGNVTSWNVSVVHVTSGDVSQLVSAVTFLQSGVARFHFTPVQVGTYQVSISRTATSHLPALVTPLPMKTLVRVQNTISKCTKRTVTNLPPQLAQTMWAMSRFSNEQRTGIPGVRGSRLPTSVVTDYAWIYPSPDDVAQDVVRRSSLQPQQPSLIGNPLSAPNDNYNYCDIIQQG